MPRMGHAKREAIIRAAIEAIDFICVSIAKTRRNNHYCATVRDDAGNEFKVFTSSSTRDAGRGMKNFQRDIRHMSNQRKGLA